MNDIEPRSPAFDDTHRDVSRVVAASQPLGLVPGGSGDDLRRALDGKEPTSGTLVGRHQR